MGEVRPGQAVSADSKHTPILCKGRNRLVISLMNVGEVYQERGRAILRTRRRLHPKRGGSLACSDGFPNYSMCVRGPVQPDFSQPDTARHHEVLFEVVVPARRSYIARHTEIILEMWTERRPMGRIGASQPCTALGLSSRRPRQSNHHRDRNA
jgi:hypothetical protein